MAAADGSGPDAAADTARRRMLLGGTSTGDMSNLSRESTPMGGCGLGRWGGGGGL